MMGGVVRMMLEVLVVWEGLRGERGDRLAKCKGSIAHGGLKL